MAIKIAKWIHTAKLYRDPRVLGILFLSFSSGLPFLLTLATLHVWLKEAEISKTTIGMFALVTIPYSLKFLWAPVLEHLKIPFICDLMGQRKGWMLTSQIMMIPALILLGASNPTDHIFLTALVALLVSFCSATQDIVVEAYRVELLSTHEVGAGASMSNLGYRLGMWTSGAGALYLASYFDWSIVYNFMAACMAVGIITTLLSQEPQTALDEDFAPQSFVTMSGIKYSFYQAYGFLKSQKEWPLILMFILVYKLGDTALNVMTAPFLLEIGFSKLEIAHVAKSFGIGAMIMGGLFAGLLLSQRPLHKVLLLCASLQILSSFMYMTQASLGHNLSLLFGTIGLDNFACGMGAATFITYLSLLCRHRYAATHFALLTSFASLCRVFFSYGAGWLADHTTWISYFGISALTCCLLFILVLFQTQHFSQPGIYTDSPQPQPA